MASGSEGVGSDQAAITENESGVDEPVGASSSSDAPTSSCEHITKSNDSSPRKYAGSPHEGESEAIELTEIKLTDFDQRKHFNPYYYNDDLDPHADLNVDYIFGGAQVGSNHLHYSTSGESKNISKTGKLNMIEIFRYADLIDIALMVGGILLALGQGAAIPLSLFFYARMLNVMIYQDCQLQSSNSSTIDQSRPLANHINVGLHIFDDVWPNSVFYALVGLGIFIAGTCHSIAWTIAGEKQIYRIRVKLFRAMLSKDAAWFDNQPAGALNNVLFVTINKLEETLTSKVSLSAFWLGMAIAGFIVAFVSDWKVAIVICSLVPLLFAVYFAMNRLVRCYLKKQFEAYSQAGAIAAEVIGNWRTVLAFNKQEFEVERYGKQLNSSQNMGIVKTVVSGASQGLMLLITYSLVGLAFWWGSSSSVVQEGGTILQIIICVMVATIALGNAYPNLESFIAISAATKTIFSIIDEKPGIDNFDDTGTWVESLRGDVRFESVSFTYSSKPDRPILRNISLYVPRGKTVALVGATGCGKSTMVQLLLRYYDANVGRITIDNVDIRELNIRWFRQQIGYVCQDPVLFNTTIRDNIRLGAVDQAFVADDDVVNACRLANAHEFITKLPLGYDTIVGELGVQLSAGQKQRIALARALVSNPKILVLDEATSALNTNSEAIVQEALDKARVGRTTLVVAHRLSTIRSADFIAVIDGGEIIEMGTHDELIERLGLYSHLVDDQQRAYETGLETPLNGSELDLTNGMRLVNEDLGNYSAKAQESLLAASLTGGMRPQLHRLDSTQSASSRNKTATSKPDARQKSSLGLANAVERGDITDGHVKRDPETLTRLQVLAVALRWGKPEIGWTFLCVVVSICSAAIQPAFAVVLSEFMGSFCPGDYSSHFKMLVGIIIMLGGAQAILMTLQHLLFALIGEKQTARMRCNVFGKILRMDAKWLDCEENRLSVIENILSNDCLAIQGISGIRIGMFLSWFVIIGVAVIYSLILDYRVALCLIVFLPLIIVTSFLYGRLSAKAARLNDLENKENAIRAMDALANIRTVMALAAEPYFMEQFAARFFTIRNRAVKNSTFMAPLYSFTIATIIWASSTFFLIGSWLMDQGDANFMDVFRIYALVALSMLPFTGFTIGRNTSIIPEIGKARQALLNIKRVIDEPISIDEEDPKSGGSLNAKVLVSKKLFETQKFSGRVEFKDVHFAYPNRPGAQVLSGISFSVEPGQFVALCGPSGGGKSTVVNLIQRLYDPKMGSILVDGVDLKASNVRWVRGNMGFVSQKPVLFAMSFADNVAYGSKDDSRPADQEIKAACEAANASEFIDNLPNSLNSQLSEAQLSNGQKQCLAIARALVRNPPMLLLDEVTSDLDAESEQTVQRILDTMEKGRTSIVIAHRLSTIEKADKIVVIERGSVVEEGTHEELMQLRGTYFHLHQFQNRNHSDG